MKVLYNKFKPMISIVLIFGLLLSLIPGTVYAAVNPWDPYAPYVTSLPQPDKREMRATWIVTAYSSDWPKAKVSGPGDTAGIEKQKQELIDILDRAVALNLNAVMFQVRPAADAMYKSDLVPWSGYLNGGSCANAGVDPGYDPLQFAIEEAHKRGLELHAWCNPYRAATAISDADVNVLKNVDMSLFKEHPEWVKKAADGVYVADPGIPEVQQWVEDSVMEIVKKYDVDGVHFDDYFYHETVLNDYDDSATFAQYGAGFNDKGDWRRNNVTALIQELSRQIRAEKPWVKFGISPAGVWGNKRDGHPDGSNTSAGGPNYDRAFADTRRWANEGTIDYICPQIYWSFGLEAAPYGEIATWWANNITNPNTQLYIGMALYKANSNSDPYWMEGQGAPEVERQLRFNANHPGIDGSFLYQSSNLSSATQAAAVNSIKVNWLSKALVPAYTWKNSVAPAMPTTHAPTAVQGGVQVTWSDNDTNNATMYYAIYRFGAGENKDVNDATKLIATVGKAATGYIDTGAADPAQVKYVVTALDRLHNESAPGTAAPVTSQPAQVTTARGTAPLLPPSVTVTLSDNSTANMMVKWEAVPPANFAVNGSFTVKGQVVNSPLTATAAVTVTDRQVAYAYPVKVTTFKGTAPVLPAEVNAIYTDHTPDVLSVSWDAPDPADYGEVGMFFVNGTVSGSSIRVQAAVVVVPSITGITPVTLSTMATVKPVLPDTVSVTYSDSTTADLPVTWDSIPAASYAAVGSFTVNGTVAGTALKAVANITVTPFVTPTGVVPVSVVTGIGAAPKLPSSVTVTYSDNSTVSRPVTWGAIDPALYAYTHRFKVNGTVDGVNLAATAAVEVAAVITIDNYEDAGGGKSMVEWTGASQTSPTGTLPTLSYNTDPAFVKSGNRSLKMEYNFTGTSGTASAYISPATAIKFEVGRVPKKIGLWIYGDGQILYDVRIAMNTTGSGYTPVISLGKLNFTGWKYVEAAVPSSFFTPTPKDLYITFVPGLVSTSHRIKSTIYIDNLVAVYGTETINLDEIDAAITCAQSVYDAAVTGTADGNYPAAAKTALQNAIDAAVSMKANPASRLADIYTATDLLNAAVEAFTATKIAAGHPPALDKTGLIAAIATAKAKLIGAAEGTQGGQYPVGAVATLTAAVTTAQTVQSSSVQEEITQAQNALMEAIKTFVDTQIPLVDKPGLKAAIDAAQAKYDAAVEGEKPGQYSVGAKATLQAAIYKATAVFANAGATKEEVDMAKTDLAAAVTDFKGKKVPPLVLTVLNAEIDRAQALYDAAVEGTNPGQYNTGAKTALQAAIHAAISAKTNTEATQTDIDSEVSALTAAIQVFDSQMVPLVVDRTALAAAITDAQNKVSKTSVGTLGGKYPQAARTTVEAAIAAAQAVANNARSTQNQVDSAVVTLNTAVATYLGTRIAAPWDPYSSFIPENTPAEKRHLRATWVSTVINLDWPSKVSLAITDPIERMKVQKEELVKILDEAAAMNFNAVMFQVRPTSDAFYKSEIAPWSYFLAGSVNGDPGYDPLEFAIEEAHKRNIELHAWFNPYRVSMPASFYGKSNLDGVKAMLSAEPKSIYSKHPEWVKIAQNRLVLDPGIPEARAYVEDCIMEVVNKYDIDGVHFDDYFYVGATGGSDGINDTATFAAYGAGFSDIKDWRRNNTYLLMKELSDKIRASKSWVKFGVSPAGVWANQKDGYPEGSPTAAGIPNYSHAFADTRRWVLEEIIDYICPQIYWTFGNSSAGFGVVADWWADLLDAHPNIHTQLYIGEGIYWLDPGEGATDPYWLNGEGVHELERQLKYNIARPSITGTILFRHNELRLPQLQEFSNLLKNDLWKTKALVPAMPFKGGIAPAAPVLSSVRAKDAGATLSWTDNDPKTSYFAIYRFSENEAANINDARCLIATVRKTANGPQTFVDEANRLGSGKYVVTALNRLHDESPMSEAVRVTPVPVVDKQGLNAAISIAGSLAEGDYTQATWTAFIAALGTARGVAANENATQEDVNNALAALNTAIDSLKPAIQSIAPEYAATVAGIAPILPGKVAVTYTDGSTDRVAVTWEGIEAGKYAQEGNFTVLGSVYESDIKAVASVKVYPAPSFGLKTNGRVVSDQGSFEDYLPLTLTVWNNSPDLVSTKVVAMGSVITIDSASFTTNFDMAGKTGTWTVSSIVYNKAGSKLENTIQFTVTTSINSMRQIIDRYGKSGEIKGPLLSQITNSLDQAEKFIDKNKPDQAAKHMEDLIKHLNNKVHADKISAKAKEVLVNDANYLIQVWNRE